jgi:hydroxypyruvate isomerase
MIDLVQRLKAHGLTQVLHNMPAGDWAGGERGIAIVPGRTDAFKAGVEKAIAYATALGCKPVNCIAGIAPVGTGEINYPFLFAHLDRIGYAGSVAAEYRPRTTAESGLGWFEAARTAQG